MSPKPEADECYLCGGNKILEREGKVRDNPDICINECETCGLVFLDQADDISEEFYAESNMHDKEVSISELLAGTKHDNSRRFRFLEQKLVNKNILDFGCGAGGFLIQARHLAKSVTGVELEKRCISDLQGKGITVKPSLNELPNDQYDLISAFHVIEHLHDPTDVIKQLGGFLSREGELIIEVPSSEDALLTLYKNQAFSEFTYWSCHLFLFNAHTLEMLARKAGMRMKWIKPIQRYPLSNHLYWLATGKPGGHVEWAFLDNEELSRAYENALALSGYCDTFIAAFVKDERSEKQ